MLLSILILRSLDLITTHLAFTRYGAGVAIEANPISAWLITTLTYPLFALFNLTLSTTLLYALSRYRLGRLAVVLFLVVNGIVIVGNTYAIVG